MNDYVVTITETRKRPFVVSASSEEYAKEIATEEWRMANLVLEQDDVKKLQLDVIDKEEYERQLSPDNIEWHKFSEQLPEDGEKIQFYINAELYYGYFHLPDQTDEIGVILYWPAYRAGSIWFCDDRITVKGGKITAWAKR